MRTAALVVTGSLAVAVLAGCGGGSGGGDGSATSPETLAAKIGCAYSAQSPGLFAREEGSCAMGDSDFDVVTFGSGAAKGRWLKFASEFGGGVLVVGSDWIVSVDTQAQAEQVRQAVGGTIR